VRRDGLLVYTRRSQKDAEKIQQAGMRERVQHLLDILAVNSYQNPPPYEKLVGDLDGAYSRQINIQHRLVYQIFEAEQTVRILRMWTHCE